MDNEKYLRDVLDGQTLEDDSEELKELRRHKKDVEALLRNKFSASSPTIRYGGSIAKGTLVRESYDLDVICYFTHDDEEAGKTLEDIYSNVKSALAEEYDVEPKTSALRLRSKGRDDFGRNFFIDVVPGRYTDDSKTDCFLHQESGQKDRLKTNLQVHIDHVKESGVVDALRLLKLWKVRKALRVKQFVFELLGIKLLAGKKSASLSAQVEHVWKEIASVEEAVAVEDPANPEGNDLMPLLRAAWPELRSVAQSTLSSLRDSGWQSVFGETGKSDKAAKVAGLSAAAGVVTHRTKPWAHSG